MLTDSLAPRLGIQGQLSVVREEKRRLSRLWAGRMQMRGAQWLPVPGNPKNQSRVECPA